MQGGGPIAIWAMPKCMSKHAKWVFPLQWNDVEVHYCITATVQNQSECRWRSWCEEKSKHAPSWHRGCRSFARPASAPIPQIEKWKKENTPGQNSMMRDIFFGKTLVYWKTWWGHGQRRLMNTLHLTWERKKHSLGLDLFTVTDGRCGLICKLTAASWLLSWVPLYIIGRQCRRAQSTHVYNSCTTIYWMERTVANVCETEHKVARHAHWFPTRLAAGSDFSTKFHLWKTFFYQDDTNSAWSCPSLIANCIVWESGCESILFLCSSQFHANLDILNF